MWGYVVMAAMVLIGTVTALAATEPEQSARAEAATRTETAFTRVLNAAIGAFSEFLTRRDAWAALAFVVLFKFTDAFSGTMTAPFVIDLGFTRNDYAAIVKGVGLAATLIGGFAGGFVARRYSLATSLWIGGVLQAVANLSFSWLALVGVNQWALAFAITAENFTSAIGTVIFVAYLSALCRNPLHTATQYALLTALAAVGRTYLSSGAGYVAKAAGWPLFFVICVVVAVPSLILLAWLQRRGHFDATGAGEGLAASPSVVESHGSCEAARCDPDPSITPRTTWVIAALYPPYDLALPSACEAGISRSAHNASGAGSPDQGDDSRCSATRITLLVLRHHAPLGDHGFAHLAGILCAGDFVDLDRDFLADEAFQLRGLRVARGDELEGFRAGLQIAQPVRRRQAARLAGELIGGDTSCPFLPPRIFMALSSPDSTSPALISLPAFGGAGSASRACWRRRKARQTPPP